MIRTACAYYWRQARHFFAIGKTCRFLAMLAGQRLELAISLFHSTACLQNRGAEAASCAAVRREAEEDWGFPVTKKQQSPTCGGSVRRITLH
jgi:hypothetical protein